MKKSILHATDRSRMPHSVLILFTALMVVIAAACAQNSVSAERAWPESLGAPVAMAAADAPDIRVLRNPGFVVGFDRRRGRAAWVAYRVEPIAAYEHMPRPQFRPDPRIEDPVPRELYKRRKYDRGHMAPNYAMAQIHGREAQLASFYYSNILPQTQRLNQLLWQRLEEIETDYLAPRLDVLWVLMGPIYDNADSLLPVAFFRIWLTRGDDDQWQAMAFIVPQDVRGDERLDQYLVAIDTIEQRTGLNVFPGFSEQQEQRVESHQAQARLWGFIDKACMPARYR